MSHILANPGVTLGCVTVGTIVLLLTVLYWWKKSSSGKGGDGGRQWTHLVPFAIAWCYGLLIVMSAGSISVLGFIDRLGLYSGQGIGHLYLVYGIGGQDHYITRGRPDLLTDPGKAVLAIWTALQIASQLWSKKRARLYSTAGVVSGFCLGLSAGVAGTAAIPLASAVNAAGGWFDGWVS